MAAKSRRPNDLTIVEPGSPMGELLRRYWQPVCTSDELRDLPQKKRSCARRWSSSATRRAGSARWSRIARTAARRWNGAASRRRGSAAAITAGSTTRKAIASTCRARPRSPPGDGRLAARPIRRWNMAVWCSSTWARRTPSPAVADVRHHRPRAHRNDVVLVGKRLWDDHALG